MTPAAVERVFGRQRLKMVTGRYVEVFREAAAPGERRRYTKRFLATPDGDFREWTEREWRLLARLVGHGVRHVPEVVQFDRGASDGTALVQTYDAGVTIDHWATLLPIERDGHALRHVFRDCAHWWSLAQHFLLALKEIHQLQLVHLDIKADNVCIPLAPADFDPRAAGRVLRPAFERLALIDFAFSLVSGERPASPLPIGWQREFPYQSPRLLAALAAGRDGNLEPTRELDWRCDMYSLAAMLQRYLPAPERVRGGEPAASWTDALYADAKALLLEIRDSHDRDAAAGQLPHDRLIEACAAPLRRPDLAASLARGWTLATHADPADAAEATAPATPLTRLEPPTCPLTVVQEPPATAPAERDAASLPTVLVTAIAAAVTRVEPRRPAAAVDAEAPAVAAVPALQPAPEPPPLPDTAAAATPPTVPAVDAVPVATVADDGVGSDNDGATTTPMPPVTPAAPTMPPPSRRRGRLLRYALPLAAAFALLAVFQQVLRSAGDASRAAARGSPASAGGAVVAAARPAPPPVQAQPAPAPAAAPSAPAQDAVAPGSDVRVAAVPAPPLPSAPPVPQAAQADDAPPNAAALPSDPAAARVARVLRVAAQSDAASQDRRILDAARSAGDAPAGVAAAPRRAAARQLNAAARDAFWNRRDVAAALALQSRAFDADPHDPEIAGNLAFYHLKASPPQADTARRLALHALASAAAQDKPGRFEDWGSLAVASALSGRPQDATHAMFVMIAVSKDLNRACRSALSAAATFGEPMKAPAQAMLSRIRARGMAADAPYCAWPPNWSAGLRLP